MHEMSLCLSMIDLVAARLRAEGAERVLRISVEVGALGHVDPEALAFCFDSAVRGSPAEGARLDLRCVPGRAYCFDCGSGVTLLQRGDGCPGCGGHALRIDDGEQLRVTEMEVI
jgi:hydrogenase nickel incorporation protein HypA/HybF